MLLSVVINVGAGLNNGRWAVAYRTGILYRKKKSYSMCVGQHCIHCRNTLITPLYCTCFHVPNVKGCEVMQSLHASVTGELAAVIQSSS